MAIRDLDGKWRSEVSIEERERALAEELGHLTPGEREAFELLIKDISRGGSKSRASTLLTTMNSVEYEREVVSPEQWIEDEYYFGKVGKNLYPQLKQDFIELFNGDYQEAILGGSIGWGKCLKQLTFLIDAETGRRWRIGDLAKAKESVLVQGSDRGVAVYAQARVRESGRKQVADLFLKSGKKLGASLDHPVLTPNGYRELGDLKSGDLVATPRKLLPPKEPLKIRDEDVVRTVVSLCGSDGEPDNWDAAALRESSGIPDEFFGLSDRQLSLLVNRFWSIAGLVVRESFPAFELLLPSERLIDDFQLILLRFGIHGRKIARFMFCGGERMPAWRLSVTGKSDLLRFAEAIGPILGKEEACRKLVEKAERIRGNSNVGIVPVDTEAAKSIRRAVGPVKNIDWRWKLPKGQYLSYESFERLCAAHDVPEGFAWWGRDIFWDRVDRTEVGEVEPVFDLEVPETRNFVADGVIVHNTHFTSVGICRMIYELTCMHSPQDSFGLSPGAQIVFPNYSTTEAVARKVIFENILSKLELSPYFQEIGFKKTQKEVRIPAKNIAILALPPKQQAALGMNVFGAVVDESNFVRMSRAGQGHEGISGSGRDEVDSLYTSLATRIKSRFMRFGRVPGMIFLVSSKTSDKAFTERKILESRTNSHIFVRDYALYEVKPGFTHAKMFKILVGRGRVRSRILKDGENVDDILESMEGTRVIEVPEDFKPEFESKLEESLRDIAGVSTESVSPFIHRTEKIHECVNESLQHPFTCVEFDPLSETDGFIWSQLVRNDPTEGWLPIHNPDALRHAHIDGSMLIKGGDATGFVVAHVAGQKVVVRRNPEGQAFAEHAPIIRVDLALRVVAPMNGQEASLGDVRRLVYEMTSKGFPIRMITMDRYQSSDSIVKFARRGYAADIVSMDTTSEPYDLMKAAFYEDRLVIYDYEPLKEELLRLEWDDMRQKVDHPRGGSKDVSDALAGVVYTLTKQFKEAPLEVKSGLYDESPAVSDNWVCVTPKGEMDNGLETLPVERPKHRLADLVDLDEYEQEDMSDGFVFPTFGES